MQSPGGGGTRSGRSPIFVFGFSSSFRTWHVWQNDGTWHDAQRFCPCEAYIECSRMKTIEWRKVSYGFRAPPGAVPGAPRAACAAPTVSPVTLGLRVYVPSPDTFRYGST